MVSIEKKVAIKKVEKSYMYCKRVGHQQFLIKQFKHKFICVHWRIVGFVLWE